MCFKIIYERNKEKQKIKKENTDNKNRSITLKDKIK